MNSNYKVEIIESSRDFSARERIAIKDITNAIKFDSAVTDDPYSNLVITPSDWAVLKIHNESAEKKDYEVYVIIDGEGKKYYTSSLAFWNSFVEIAEEMKEEPFSIEVYKVESRNYKGKYFITCSIVME